MIEYILAGVTISAFVGWIYLIYMLRKQFKFNNLILCEHRRKLAENKPEVVCYKCLEEFGDKTICLEDIKNR